MDREVSSEIPIAGALLGMRRALEGISREGDGQIDFSNTATLRVTLPAGVEFVGATGALASDVIVPEPTGGPSLLAGIVLVAALGRRRRR